MALSVAATLGQSEPGSNGNEEVLHLLLTSWTVASPSDCLVSYPGHSFGRGYTPLQRCSRCILLPNRLGCIF